jgi:hypothetical protein
LLADSAALTFDATNANLVITSGVTGNGFTQYSNSIDGGVQGYVGSGKALVAGSGNTTLGVRGETSIFFGIGSVYAMGLNSAGNLGLGGVPSGSWLTTFSNKVMQFGPVGSINSLSASTTNNQTFFSSNVIDQGGGAYSRIYADWITRYTQNSGKHVWQTSTTQTGAVAISDLMTLISGGDLGIGIALPTSRLQHFESHPTRTGRAYKRTD